MPDRGCGKGVCQGMEDGDAVGTSSAGRELQDVGVAGDAGRTMRDAGRGQVKDEGAGR